MADNTELPLSAQQDTFQLCIAAIALLFPIVKWIDPATTVSLTVEDTGQLRPN